VQVGTCGGDDPSDPVIVPIERIDMPIPSSTVQLGTQSFDPFIVPANVPTTQITWTASQGTTVEMLWGNLNVNFTQLGPASITATSPCGYTNTWNVEVLVIVPIEEISLPPWLLSETMGLGGTHNFSFSISPYTALGTPITWTASPGTTVDVAPWNGEIFVTFNQPGTARITATSDCGYTNTWNVQVQAGTSGGDDPSDPAFVPVSGINSPNWLGQSFQVGASRPLSGFTVLPANATNREVVFEVENARIESAAGAGTMGSNIVFTQAGTAVLTATVINGLGNGQDYSQKWEIEVLPTGGGGPGDGGDPNFVPVTGINSPNWLGGPVQVGVSYPLSGFTIIPANATNNTLWFEPGDDAIINWDSFQITFLQAGTTRLSVSAASHWDGTGEVEFTRAWNIEVLPASGGGPGDDGTGNPGTGNANHVTFVEANIPQTATLGATIPFQFTVETVFGAPIPIQWRGSEGVTFTQIGDNMMTVRFTQPGPAQVVANAPCGCGYHRVWDVEVRQ
jgi:hypothetical protein